MALMLLWKGPAPRPGLLLFANHFQMRYQNYFVFYIATMWIYILPYFLYRVRFLISSGRLLMVSASAALLYPLIPVRASNTTVRMGSTTNGRLHKVIQMIANHNFYAEHCIFALCFAVGLLLLIRQCVSIIADIKNRSFTIATLLDMATISFLIVMPAQHQVWEKYLIMLIPIVCARTLMPFSGAAPPEAGTARTKLP
jgi:hypothetical protein